VWFLAEAIKREMDAARAAGFVLSSEQVAELTVASRDNGKMQVVGRTAVIPVEGVLTERPDWFAAYFGGGNTTYPNIKQAIAEANGSKEVDSIELAFGYSPGGNVNGLFSAMDTIRDSSKPVTATVKGGALSAAYGLASQAGRIVAADRGTSFGSVGVAMDTYVYDGNIKEVSIASTEAPKKRPDLLTDEGKAMVREELDAIHEVFVESIAAGRGTTEKKVNANFGRGAMVLAEQALQAGMIDSIGQQPNNQSATAAAKTEVRPIMDLQTLKADHRAVYDAAVEIGKAKERDRVTAHLVLGEKSGALDVAIKAVKEGEEMTSTLTATYLAAGMDSATAAARVDDNVDVHTDLEPQGGDSLDAQVAREFDKLAKGDQEGLING
jgi:ClpP class serine protease